MNKLIFQATVMDVYRPGPAQITAAAKITKDKPRFCVLLMLALLNKRNGNGHRLSLGETEKALAALDDKQTIPGNFNHERVVCGASTKIWIETEGWQYPRLMLEAVYWTRDMSTDALEKVTDENEKGDLGASWEIDQPYELEAYADEPDTWDVKDFGLSGFCVTVGKEPAEGATKGSVTITARKEGDTEGTEEEAAQATYKCSCTNSECDYEVESEEHCNTLKCPQCGSQMRRAERPGPGQASQNIVAPEYVGAGNPIPDFLYGVPCPTCGATYGQVKVANLEDGIFELECPEAKHRFLVEILVISKGEEATYRLSGDNELKPIVKEVNSMADEKEYTKEELDAAIKTATEAALEEERKKVEVETTAKIKEEVEAAKTAAVQAFKESQVVASKRVDEIHAITPFDSEEAKLAVKDEYAAMTDEAFEALKAEKEKDKKIADLEAKVKKLSGEEDLQATNKSGLPTGEEPNKSVEKEEFDVGAMLRNL